MPGVVFETLRTEPLIVPMAADHRLARSPMVNTHGFAHERIICVPAARSPVLRSVTDAYARTVGIEIVPYYEVDNVPMVISLAVSTGGVAPMPLYACNLLPPTVVSRPLQGYPPTIDVTLGFRPDNPTAGLPGSSRGSHG